MGTITRSRSSITCPSIYPRRMENTFSCVRQWMLFLKIKGRQAFHVLWKSIMHHCLNIQTHSHNHVIINGNSNYLLVYIWLTHRLHVTIQMIPYSMNVIQLNRLFVRVTMWLFQWMICYCSIYYLLRVIQMICNTYWMKEDYPIYCYQILQSYWIGLSMELEYTIDHTHL